MNGTFLQFLVQQILPPWLAAMGMALFLCALAMLVDRTLLRPAAEIALLGMSFLPGIGLFAGMIYDLLSDGNGSLLLVSEAVTLLAFPLVLWGGPAGPCSYPVPSGWSG